MRYENLAALRDSLARHHRIELTDSEWAEVTAKADVNPHAVLDDHDFEAISGEILASQAFAATLQREVARARDVVALTDGPAAHADAGFAFRSLRAIADNRELHDRWTTEIGQHAEGLGKLLLACTAAQWIADRHHAPFGVVLFALLAGSDGITFDPPPTHSGAFTFLEAFSKNAVAAGHAFAFGDLRKSSLSQDVELLLAVERIVRKERRSVSESSTAERWHARWLRYEEEHASAVGRSFRDAEEPGRAFQQAFVVARKRVFGRTGPDWGRITDIR